MYCRTGLKGYLIFSLGSIIALFGVVGIIILHNVNANERTIDVFGLIFIVILIIIACTGYILLASEK